MSKLPTSMVKPILESMYACRQEMVPCFIGAPGIGKTQGIHEFAREKGVNVVTFILSNTVPSEISGIRMPDKDTKKLEVFDDSRMASLKDGDILFFDEILEASPMLWSACLTLIQDRIMASGRKLPDVFIVAASNQVTSPAIIPASTRDRFQFIELFFDANTWEAWFYKKHGVEPTDNLVTRIQDDSDQYNILTPRRIDKLYTWMKDSSGNLYDKWKVVEAMFDADIANQLKAMVKHIPSAQEQIINALNNSNIDFNIDRHMSLKEIMTKLQESPYWDFIQETLANIEFVEDKPY